MKVYELVEKLNLKILSEADGLDRDINGCYVSDLLSDVMGNAKLGDIWITLQSHSNVVAVASLKGIACIILVKNINAGKDTLDHSIAEKIPILQTSMSTYEITAKIFNLLNS